MTSIPSIKDPTPSATVAVGSGTEGASGPSVGNRPLPGPFVTGAGTNTVGSPVVGAAVVGGTVIVTTGTVGLNTLTETGMGSTPGLGTGSVVVVVTILGIGLVTTTGAVEVEPDGV